MKIHPLKHQTITFKNRLNDGENDGREAATVMAGGAGGAAVATGISRLNKTALGAGNRVRVFQGFSTTTQGITKGMPKNARNITEGIFECFVNFAGRLPNNKPFNLLGRALKSPAVRKFAGFSGGVIAFATAIFGLAETTATLGQLAAENN